MDKALLDTDTLSEILKGKNETVVRNAQAYRVRYSTLTTSAITVAEIVKGLHKKGREDAIVSFQQTLGAIDVLSLGSDAGILAGRIYAELEKAGRPIGRADPLIAGIALSNNLALATGNVRHFQQVIAAGFPLHVVDWHSELS